MNIIILIPAYHPDDKLIEYVSQLNESYVKHIIVVNDGSGTEYQDIFDKCEKHDKCKVISYENNMGKGFALKTGLKYCMDNFSDYDGVITCDADGQHLLEDTLKITDQLVANKNSLVLGVRDFTLQNIPWRSRFGNTLTSSIFKFVFHKDISDTQTGLRGIPANLVPFMIDIKGDRFEYETNVLVNCFNNSISILQIPISTVYIDDNGSSHFNAVVDSAKIYWVIFRQYILYALSAITSFLIDISSYSLIIGAVFVRSSSYGIYIASYFSRTISSIANYMMNRRIVFNSKDNVCKSALKYAATVLLVITVSSNLVKLFSTLLSVPLEHTPIIKVCVDVFLFCITYMIEKHWVFKR